MNLQDFIDFINIYAVHLCEYTHVIAYEWWSGANLEELVLPFLHGGPQFKWTEFRSSDTCLPADPARVPLQLLFLFQILI